MILVVVIYISSYVKNVGI